MQHCEAQWCGVKFPMAAREEDAAKLPPKDQVHGLEEAQGGRSPCPCFCSLTKGLCPSQLLLRGTSAQSWGRQQGEMSMLTPPP